MKLAGLVALCALLVSAGAKKVSGSFHLSAGDETHGPEYEISKYTFAVGKSMIKGKVTYSASDQNWMTSPALYLFNDDKWDEYHKAPACMDKVQAAHTVVQIGSKSGEQQAARSNIDYGYNHLAKNAKTWTTQKGNKIEWSFEWEIEHTERSKGWFLISADCALEQFNTRVAPMAYEIQMLNPGGNHLPADEHWLPTVYILVLTALCFHAGYCCSVLSLTMEHHKKVHLVVKLFAIAYFLQLLSLVFELVHQLIYSLNGRGVFILDFLSELSEGICALIISFVLICLASGWTLVEQGADAKRGQSVATIFRNPRGLVQSGNWLGNLLALCLVGLVCYVMFLIFLNKLSDDDFTKFHDSDSEAGTTLIRIRLILFAFFGLSMFATIRKLRTKSTQQSLVSFLIKLLIFGSLWFVTFPVAVTVANLSPHYHRHRIVVIGVLVVQAICLAVLSHQFLKDESAYAKLSTAWESGMLPGAGGLISGKKIVKE